MLRNLFMHVRALWTQDIRRFRTILDGSKDAAGRFAVSIPIREQDGFFRKVCLDVPVPQDSLSRGRLSVTLPPKCPADGMVKAGIGHAAEGTAHRKPRHARPLHFLRHAATLFVKLTPEYRFSGKLHRELTLSKYFAIMNQEFSVIYARNLVERLYKLP